jgi:hypothetical protein
MKSVTLAAVAALLLGSPASAAETLSYDVVFHDKVITAKTDALSAGDRIIINDDLLIAGTKVGMAAGACTITDEVNGFAICNVSFVLEKGALSIQFVNSPPPEKNFAILGGSDAYAGRTGAGTLIEHGDGTGSVTFRLD